MTIEDPTIHDDGPYRTLRFSRNALQSRMSRESSAELVIAYTRTMMGFVLLQPRPEVIAMIGLGGGSLARYCLRYLPASRFIGVELNPKVVALRDEFDLPPDGDRFRIVEADGAKWIAEPEPPLDVLLLDAFEARGVPRTLRSGRFFERCHRRLRSGGVLVSNMWSGDPQLPATIERLRDAFDGQVVGIRCEDAGHRILFAAKGVDLRDAAIGIVRRAEALQAAHTVDLVRVARQIETRVLGRPTRSAPPN